MEILVQMLLLQVAVPCAAVLWRGPQVLEVSIVAGV